MKKSKLTKSFKKGLVLFLGVLLPILFVNFIIFTLAWTEPGQTPPTQSIPEFLNTSSTTQTKSGALGLGGILEALTAIISTGSTTKPTCAASNEGIVWIEEGATGVADSFTVCRDVGGSYAWVAVAFFNNDADRGCYEDQALFTGAISNSDQYNFQYECHSADKSWSLFSESPVIWKDNMTGLYWTAELTRTNWDGAISYCPNLTHAGRSDWRVPTKDELMQITVYTNIYAYKGGHNMIYSAGVNFSDSGTSCRIWSVNERSDNSSYAFHVRPDNGEIYLAWPIGLKSQTNSVRCVRRD